MRILVAFVLIALIAPPAPGAEEAAELFKSLYADRLAQVERTRATDDDLELAGQMIDARQTLGGPSALGFMLCRHAGPLAARSSDGLEMAVQIIEALADVDHPERLSAARRTANTIQSTYTRSVGEAKRKAAAGHLVDAMSAVAAIAEQEGELAVGITMLQRATAVASAVAADRTAAVKSRLDRLLQRQRAEKEAAVLRDRLEKDPQDTEAAEQLANFYLVRMQNTRQALKYAKRSTNRELVRNLTAATLPLESLSDTASLDLGIFYVEAADDASEADRPLLYERAAAALNHFLEVHDSRTSLARTKARLYLERVNSRLTPQATAVAAAPGAGPSKSGGTKLEKPDNPGPKVRFYRLVVPDYDYGSYVYQVALFPNGKAAIHGEKYTGGRDTYVGSWRMIGPKLALNAGVNGKFYFVRSGDKLVGANRSKVTFTELSHPPEVFRKYVKP